MITIDSNSYIIYSATNSKKISLIRFLYVVAYTFFKNVYVTLNDMLFLHAGFGDETKG
jgi:hypothetical protein